MRCFVYHNEEKDVEIWRLSGDLDERARTELEPLAVAFVDSEITSLILDCERVTFMNSTFAGSFIHFFNAIKESKKWVCVAGAQKNLYDVITLLGIDQAVPMFPSTEAALQKL